MHPVFPLGPADPAVLRLLAGSGLAESDSFETFDNEGLMNSGGDAATAQDVACLEFPVTHALAAVGTVGAVGVAGSAASQWCTRNRPSGSGTSSSQRGPVLMSAGVGSESSSRYTNGQAGGSTSGVGGRGGVSTASVQASPVLDRLGSAPAPRLMDLSFSSPEASASKRRGSSSMGARAASVSVQQHLVAGGLAGAASRTATAPLETVRLRMMTSGAPGSSLTGTARELWRESGWRAFFRGNLLNVLRAAPQKAIDFGAFETFKSLLHQRFPNSPPELRLAASGALAGGLSTLLLYPLDSVRGRMLAQRVGAGGGRRFASVADAFVTIVKTEGLPSLYRGLAPSFLSILPEAAITYGFSDLLKMAYQRATGKDRVEPGPALAFGVASAFTGQLVAYPLEVVARRAQASPVNQSVAAALQSIVRTQGVGGLYNGIVPATAKLIPMAVISFGVYEAAKLLLTHVDFQEEAQKLQDQWKRHPAYELI